MRINLTDFYDVGQVTFWRTSTKGKAYVPMYDIELISKSTGEVITWSFTEEYFDKLLDEMEQEYKYLYCTIHDIPIIYHYGKII